MAGPTDKTRESRTRKGRARASRARKDAGFSLLEVMVVLIIIGLVATIATPQLMDYLDRAKVETAKTQIRSLETVLELYRLDMGRFPSEQHGLEALMRAPDGADAWQGPYLKSADSLIDPWDAPYLYDVSEDGRRAAVLSLGADQQEGGEGIDADIRL